MSLLSSAPHRDVRSELVRIKEFIWQDKKTFGTAFFAYFLLLLKESDVAYKAKLQLSKLNSDWMSADE
jgi:hypothetical protein